MLLHGSSSHEGLQSILISMRKNADALSHLTVPLSRFLSRQVFDLKFQKASAVKLGGAGVSSRSSSSLAVRSPSPSSGLRGGPAGGPTHDEEDFHPTGGDRLHLHHSPVAPSGGSGKRQQSETAQPSSSSEGFGNGSSVFKSKLPALGSSSTGGGGSGGPTGSKLKSGSRGAGAASKASGSRGEGAAGVLSEGVSISATVVASTAAPGKSVAGSSSGGGRWASSSPSVKGPRRSRSPEPQLVPPYSDTAFQAREGGMGRAAVLAASSGGSFLPAIQQPSGAAGPALAGLGAISADRVSAAAAAAVAIGPWNIPHRRSLSPGPQAH